MKKRNLSLALIIILLFVCVFSIDLPHTYSARADGAPYTIIYRLNGGENVRENPSWGTMGVDLQIYDPVREGYTFLGWTYFGQRTPERNVVLSGIESSLFVLNANWEHNHIFENGVCTGCGASDVNYVPPHVHFYLDGYCYTCGEMFPGLNTTHEHHFVDGICECGVKDPDYVPPHVHTYENGVCTGCGEVDPDYVPPHVHTYENGVCTGCGEVDPDYVPPHVHTYENGVCTGCGEVDPDYVPPHVHEFIHGKCACGEIDPNYKPSYWWAYLLGVIAVASAIFFPLYLTRKKRKTLREWYVEERKKTVELEREGLTRRQIITYLNERLNSIRGDKHLLALEMVKDYYRDTDGLI